MTPGGTKAVDELLHSTLATVRGLRQRLSALEARTNEPIAITGIGCRLPGGTNSPQQFWEKLVAGADLVTEVPPERWDAAAFDATAPDIARGGLRHGAFLDDVDAFDPYFFGISPREAARMDPQQRIFLEVAWEALEDAGQVRSELRGSQTGVFVGTNSADYLQLQLQDPADIDPYTILGGTGSVMANRLSYTLDLRGPSLVVDTACSSSLVALHLAVQSLRQRDCDLAVVGGVNLILSPHVALAHASGLPLAPDGRCKTFAASANGYVRSEGVLAVVCKRLSQAVADNDRIWAVIHGTAVNQDGLTNGIAAPNGLAQRAVIRRAVESARVDPARVTLIEAHGSGTALGDPIEFEALAEIYGAAGTATDPCALGSVKTNLGHLEAAAGLAGLVKTALSIHHRTVAPNLHLDVLNPHLEIAGSRFSIPTSARAWDVPDDRRFAAVNSFGAGGTNAHVVLGPPPAATTPETGVSGLSAPPAIPISADDEETLRALAVAYRDHLSSDQTDQLRLADVAHTATVRRTRYRRRLVVVGGSPHEVADRLTHWVNGDPTDGVVSGVAGGLPGTKVVFVVPGQGAQRPSMGRQLMQVCRDFRDAVEECDEALRGWLGRSVIDDLRGLADDDRFDRIDLVQPALFALSVGLAARCRAYGVEPDLVVGHSMGEVAAAHIAGALSLDDAARVIARRSTLLSRIRNNGAMLVVGLPEDKASSLVEAVLDKVSLAVCNSPSSTVLSGDAATLTDLTEQLRRRHVFHRFVKVDVASHSPQVEVIRDDLLRELADLRPRPGKVPIYSTTDGRVCDGSHFDAHYWMRNLRNPVRYWSALRELVDTDHGIFVELGPHPVLLQPAIDALAAAGRAGVALPAMRRTEPETYPISEILGALHAYGLPAELPRLLAPGARTVALPRQRWRHERLWFRLERQTPVTANGRGSTTQEPEPEPEAADERSNIAPPPPSAEAAPTNVRQAVLDTISNALGIPVRRIDPDEGFFQMGMDSMLAARVRARLQGLIGRTLPATTLFEHATVDALATYLTQLVGEPAVDTPARSGADAPSPAPAGDKPAHPRSETSELTQDLAGLDVDELFVLLNEENQLAAKLTGGAE
ncbi:beta-ketoacyl synthase N-terminal-like domain-containing protein [Micromonospora arborensis]|uniref:type I polyketide synthase n=1 Tax=Micromonospora arborensis TaxID=2116518 RepID=UPI0034284E7A